MSLGPTQWDRIESICAAALARRPAERAAFLDSACAANAELRREVQSLLDQVTGDPGFLERPIVQLRAVAPSDAADDVPLTGFLGPYQLVRRLGRGGMGDVYLAVREAEEIPQEVALKVIRRGLDTDEVLRRFRLERRILAKLDHPNIARLLDAAVTEDGRPYFVMEYVDGLSLIEHCDQYALTIRERVSMFQAVCGAVQHAHHLRVIHRDLKPQNILVTADGVPKLLDFGIGKVLSSHDAFGSAVVTQTNQRLLTAEYAAPEQITGAPITPATDVHALGVLLYELLTGHHPYVAGASPLHEVQRAITQVEPLPPSVIVERPRVRRAADGADERVTPHQISARRGTDTSGLRRQLRGDLDTIVLRALRKDPLRRYPSAVELAECLVAGLAMK